MVDDAEKNNDVEITLDRETLAEDDENKDKIKSETLIDKIYININKPYDLYKTLHIKPVIFKATRNFGRNNKDDNVKGTFGKTFWIPFGKLDELKIQCDAEEKNNDVEITVDREINNKETLVKDYENKDKTKSEILIDMIDININKPHDIYETLHIKPVKFKATRNFRRKNKDENVIGTFGKTYWVQFGFGHGKGSERDGAFLVLVFSVLLIMLLATAAINAVVYNIEDLRNFFRRLNPVVLIGVGLVGLIVQYGFLMQCARRCPVSCCCLSFGVFMFSFICCYFTARFSTEIIFLAFISTSIVVFVCLLIAIFGFDFTKFMLYIIIAAVAVSAVSLVILLAMVIFKVKMPILAVVILVVGVIVQSIVFCMEIQIILGGGAVELNEEDWALGAYMLYTSIIDIFLKLLQILGILNDILD